MKQEAENAILSFATMYTVLHMVYDTMHLHETFNVSHYYFLTTIFLVRISRYECIYTKIVSVHTYALYI